MGLKEVVERAIEPALALLPARMDTPVARVMLLTRRSSNGTPLFQNPCPDCRVVRFSDRRRLGKPCMACANRRRATHGLSDHPLYRKLQNMRSRCEIPSASGYEYYGARGISVCDEWRNSPATFVVWALANGYLPGMEIDRIDVNGPYSPGNCRFIPHAENSRVRRNSQCTEEKAEVVRGALADGESVGAAANTAGVPYMVAWHIHKGNTWREK
nr:MAG TPA: PROTEIN/DNA Complex catalytic motif, Helix-turn-helix DNA [Caudoviricetes sp.]